MPLELVLGDITEQHVDAIVNAANSSLMGGGGVDGAIHRRGGPDILVECRSLRAGQYRDGLPVGQAVATTAGRLPARWVIHTVGPVYSKRADRSEALRSCYGASLRVAAAVDAGSVAFPLISSGIYGWPVEDALRQALTVLRGTDQEVRLVLWQESTLHAAERLMQG
jgi:O-acetyl-ADP-ribose deacetylase